jgi:hypothetical protein
MFMYVTTVVFVAYLVEVSLLPSKNDVTMLSLISRGSIPSFFVNLAPDSTGVLRIRWKARRLRALRVCISSLFGIVSGVTPGCRMCVFDYNNFAKSCERGC